MPISIMAVDDSMNALESLQWMFFGDSFYVFTCDDPFEALNLIGSAKFAVIVAEHSMRKMDGLELLKRARKKSPDTIGILMTGYTDFKGVLDAIYPGCVYRYVKNPLDHKELKQVLRMAVTQYHINCERTRQVVLI